MNIRIKNGQKKITLTKPEQERLRRAGEIVALLSEHDKCDENVDALAAVRTVLLRYCVHDVQQTLLIVAEEDKCLSCET